MFAGAFRFPFKRAGKNKVYNLDKNSFVVCVTIVLALKHEEC